MNREQLTPLELDELEVAGNTAALSDEQVRQLTGVEDARPDAECMTTEQVRQKLGLPDRGHDRGLLWSIGMPGLSARRLACSARPG